MFNDGIIRFGNEVKNFLMRLEWSIGTTKKFFLLEPESSESAGYHPITFGNTLPVEISSVKSDEKMA